MSSLKILYEDTDIIVCHKPSGVATQTKRLGQQDMESLLRNHRAQNGETPYIGVVHRLDQPVEGVMVFAKNQHTASELSRQVRERQIGKYYYAAVVLHAGRGDTDRAESDTCEIPQSGTLTDYMVWNPKTNVSTIVGSQETQSGKAKKAVLDYTVIAADDKLALLDICLHTGRHHQIRLQLSHMGYPIFGDSKYGKAGRKESLALCSYRLQFCHPCTRRQMDFSIEPDNPAIVSLKS